MKNTLTRVRVTLLISVFLLFIFGHSSSVQGTQSEIENITAPLRAYLTGHIRGDKNMLGAALHSEGKLSYLRNGEYRKLEFADYLSRMKSRPKDDVVRIPYIERIDVTGDMAIAKLKLDYASILFTDYMTLLKIAGEWKITNKIAYSVREPKNNKPDAVDMRHLLTSLNLSMHRLIHGELTQIEPLLHKEAKIVVTKKGKQQAMDFAIFVKQLHKDVEKTGKLIDIQILDIDATGNVAIGKLAFSYEKALVTCYLSLLEIDGKWTIVYAASSEEYI